jgi:3-oxoacyl-[acyl-carrier protein] reductase
MSDFLLDIGKNPRARKLIQRLGLPVAIPVQLHRAKGPAEARPLHDYDVAVGGQGELAAVIARTVAGAGANPFVVGDEDALACYKQPGEAYGRPAQLLDPSVIPAGFRAHALIFDGTAIADAAGLHGLYEFFHPLIGYLGTSSRVIVLGRSPSTRKAAAAAAAQAGLEGFVRAVGKEIGKRGSTAQVVYVDDGAEDRVEGVLRFLLSPRSAFISLQPFRVTARAKGDAADEWVRPLDGKVAVVTGAARGIGEATARLLASEGAHVVCLDRPADDALVSQVARDLGGSVLLADVTDADAPALIARELKQRHGGVDIVVHNAGVTRDKTIGKMSVEYWDQAVDINLGAVIRITDELLKGVLRDGGRIICLSSVSGIAGNVGQSNYSASKAGLVGFVTHQAAALEKRGITVNAIAPGFIETRLTAAIPVVIREVGRRLSSLGQGGLPDDVGQAVTFLATPGAIGITGSVVRVCGGAFIGA